MEKGHQLKKLFSRKLKRPAFLGSSKDVLVCEMYRSLISDLYEAHMLAYTSL